VATPWTEADEDAAWADGLGVVVGLGVAVGRTEADALAVGTGVATVPAGVAVCGPVVAGVVLAGAAEDFGGVVSWVPVDSAGTETGEGEGCPIPRIKYADAPVAIITATIPMPIRIKGSLELEGLVFTAETELEPGWLPTAFGSALVTWGANTGATVTVVGLVSVAESCERSVGAESMVVGIVGGGNGEFASGIEVDWVGGNPAREVISVGWVADPVAPGGIKVGEGAAGVSAIGAAGGIKVGSGVVGGVAAGMIASCCEGIIGWAGAGGWVSAGSVGGVGSCGGWPVIGSGTGVVEGSGAVGIGDCPGSEVVGSVGTLAEFPGQAEGADGF
jgi:hypothetical protein